jgi:hypothetical protein
LNALEDDMRRLAALPLLGVVLVCITWVLLCMFVPLLWISIQMRWQMASLKRYGGVADASVNVDGLIVLLPPLVFFVAWLFARHRTPSRSGAPGGVIQRRLIVVGFRRLGERGETLNGG